MERLMISVKNVKCNGCVTTIQEHLMKLDNVDIVDVDKDKGLVVINGNSLNLDYLKEQLSQLGYPAAI
jgi:copper chaperone CopZ